MSEYKYSDRQSPQPRTKPGDNLKPEKGCCKMPESVQRFLAKLYSKLENYSRKAISVSVARLSSPYRISTSPKCSFFASSDTGFL